jgi:hypothetical protein
MKKLLFLLSVVIAGCGGGNTESSVTPSVTPSVAAVTEKSVLIPTEPFCILKTYSSSYPNEFLGSNTIPTPTQTFDPSIMRGIGIKDYYPYDNSCTTNLSVPYNIAISQAARLLYQQTLDRLKADGVDTVEIYQYGPVNDFNATTWVAEDWQIPKSDLLWFFQEAHNKNLKVTLVWQLWSVDSKGNLLNTTNPSLAEITKVLNGWNDIIVNMAKISNEGHVDNLLIQWSAFYFPSLTQYPEYSTLAFLKIIDNVRAIYNGKLFMGTPRFFDKRIIQKVDAIVVEINTGNNWSYIDDMNISVNLAKQRTLDAMAGTYLDFSLYSGMNPKDIPVIWNFNVQSRDKALSENRVEDGFCITTVNGAPVDYNDPLCMQKTYKTDFSVQAIAIEGAFQAIKEQAYFKTYGVNFSTGYWLTDTLTPSAEGFPNLSQSIRGKPAEKIVKFWYSKG